MTNLFAALILLGIVASASYFVVRSKKRGQKCIGCPYSGPCGKCACNRKGEASS